MKGKALRSNWNINISNWSSYLKGFYGKIFGYEFLKGVKYNWPFRIQFIELNIGCRIIYWIDWVNCRKCNQWIERWKEGERKTRRDTNWKKETQLRNWFQSETYSNISRKLFIFLINYQQMFGTNNELCGVRIGLWYRLSLSELFGSDCKWKRTRTREREREGGRKQLSKNIEMLFVARVTAVENT